MKVLEQNLNYKPNIELAKAAFPYKLSCWQCKSKLQIDSVTELVPNSSTYVVNCPVCGYRVDFPEVLSRIRWGVDDWRRELGLPTQKEISEEKGDSNFWTCFFVIFLISVVVLVVVAPT